MVLPSLVICCRLLPVRGVAEDVISRRVILLAAGVSALAVVAAAALIYVAYYVPNRMEPVEGMATETQYLVTVPAPAPAQASDQADMAAGLAPVGELRGGAPNASDASSGPQQVPAGRDGNEAMNVQSQDAPAMRDNKDTPNQGALTPGGPEEPQLAADEVSAPIPAAGEVSTPAPETVNLGYIAGGAQPSPETSTPPVATFAGVAQAPSVAAAEAPATVTGGTGASDAGPRVAGRDANDQAGPIPKKTALKYPNLGSHLNGLVASVEEGRATARDAAEGASIYRDESVAVTIRLSGRVAEVVAFLEDNGGDPRNVGEDYIEAYVPVPLLGAVSERPGVIRVREIIPPQPAQVGAASRP